MSARLLRTLCAALLPALAGCPVALKDACPRCVVLSPHRPPPLPAGVERVYVFLPGILGYGWEWDGAQRALKGVPGTAVVVQSWEPWRSLSAGGDEVALGLSALLRRAPPSLREVVVIGHSVGGLVLALAAAKLRVPEGVHVRALTIGAPFAGTHISLFEYEDPLHTPSPFAVGGTFSAWPRPAPRVTLEVYPTTWPNDPVMKPRNGHDPGTRKALPPQAVVRALPVGIDHNVAVAWVARQLAQEAHRELAQKAARGVGAAGAAGEEPLSRAAGRTILAP
jgi:pimeloyl-ACP methyl ester carboxylesterase